MKDIIIRGGENIPVVEIEALLHGHAAVQIAAIVAMPMTPSGKVQKCVLREQARALAREAPHRAIASFR